jgi:UDP:flavonoid glycosyltransferase YjiC (YdhE family)
MRVLVSAGAGFGHLVPLLPLALAFRDGGAEVLVATAAERRAIVEGAGLAFHPAGPSQAEVDEAFAPVFSRSLGLPISERRSFVFAARFAEIEAPGRLADLRAAADTFAPDIIVHESADLAAPLVAAERGLRSVNHGFGRVVPKAVLRSAGTAAAPLWIAAGLEPDPLGGAYRGILVDIWPDSLDRAATPAGIPVERLRPVEAVQRADSAGRPLVYVTLGTVFNEPAAFRALLDGLAEVDCDVLATTGTDPAALGPVPHNARVETFVPQERILPRCALVVTHGGSGSLLGALAHGVPVLLVPQAADQFENADACATAGVGRVLLPSQVTTDAVGTNARAILADTSTRARAATVAREIAAMPSPAELASRLARLTTRP